MTFHIAKQTTEDERLDRLLAVPRPVVAYAVDYPAGHAIAPHAHPRGQLLHAGAGVMTVRTDAGIWVVPPRRGVWVPAGVAHEVRAGGALQMRTLYVDTRAARGLPSDCCVVNVSPLLRELILRATALPPLYGRDEPAGRLMAVILDELSRLDVAPLHLPMSQHPRLRLVLDALIERPADRRTLAEWGRRVGASSRTLARIFHGETGLTFGAWRRQARLLEALNRLARRQPVTTVALDLGYDSPSAFIAMFRRALGTTPKRYFER